MTIGSLCSGYGGLDLAAEAVFGGRTIWHADPAPGPARVLATRWAGVPNLGDLTTIDWAALPPVNILTAGYPCQPFSLAGRRKGSTDVRHLWPHIREAIRLLRPEITILENVAGHRSLGFDRVVGDMAEDGLDVRWMCLRASDVGACHARTRLFAVVYAATAADATGNRRPVGVAEPAWPKHGSAAPDSDPTVADAGSEERARRAGLCADEPTAFWGPRSGYEDDDAGFPWGDYEPAIARWSAIIGRRPPRPVVKGRNAGRALSPRFVEWMMGLPAGWVTDVQGVNRRQALELLGNGVVPQQAEAAIRSLLGVSLLTGSEATA